MTVRADKCNAMRLWCSPSIYYERQTHFKRCLVERGLRAPQLIHQERDGIRSISGHCNALGQTTCCGATEEVIVPKSIQ